MGSCKSNPLPEKFGNFNLWLERVLAPVGVRAPPTTDYRLLLVAQADGSSDQQRFHISMTELPNLDIEQHVSGCIYRSDEEKKQTTAYIREQAVKYLQHGPCELYFPATGWYKTPGEQAVFCAGSVTLSDAHAEGQRSDQVSSHPELQFAHHGSGHSGHDISEMAPKFLNSLWTHPEYRIPAYAYTIFSSLRSRWSEVDLPFAAVLFLWGESGSGKTTLARNYCQPYEDEYKKFADEWDARSTKAALTNILYEARDRVVLYDDVCKSSNRADQSKRRDNAVELLRLAANETVQTKASGKTNVIQPCRSGLVITSEILPEERSELTRCVLLCMEKFHVGGTSDDRVLAAGMLEAYLKWYAQHGEEEFAALRQQRAAFTTDEYPGFTRLHTSVLQLNWCFDSFMRFLGTIPTCGPYLDQQHTTEVNRIFKKVLEREIGIIRDMEQSRLPLEKQILIGIQSQKLPCMIHKGCRCVRFDELMAFLRECPGNSGLSEKKVSAYLRNHHLVDVDASNRISKKINGERFVFLSMNI